MTMNGFAMVKLETAELRRSARRSSRKLAGAHAARAGTSRRTRRSSANRLSR